MRKFGLKLNVPITTHIFVKEGQVFELPYLRPADYLRCLLQAHARFLLGGYDLFDAEVPDLFRQFWIGYQLYHPGHDIYKADASRLPFTVPYTLHGDGGRTQKKQPLEMLSLHPAIGLNTCEGEASKCKCPHKCDWSKHRLNTKHNSYLTHFLVTAFPSKQWPQGLLVDFIQNLASQLRELFETGLHVGGRKFFFCCIGFRADMEFHIKCLRESGLDRSYEHVGRVTERMVCHECHAGDPETPFEDINMGAGWENTVCSTFPWSKIPPFEQINFSDWRHLPSDSPLFFRRDTFHVFRLGFLASFLR